MIFWMPSIKNAINTIKRKINLTAILAPLAKMVIWCKDLPYLFLQFFIINDRLVSAGTFQEVAGGYFLGPLPLPVINNQVPDYQALIRKPSYSLSDFGLWCLLHQNSASGDAYANIIYSSFVPINWS